MLFQHLTSDDVVSKSDVFPDLPLLRYDSFISCTHDYFGRASIFERLEKGELENDDLEMMIGLCDF